MRFSTLKISTRLFLLILLTAIGTALLTGAFLVSERNMLMEERQNAVKQTVEVAHSMVNHYYELAQKGKLTEEAAKEAAIGVLRDMRYNKNDYFSLTTENAFVIMHPIKTELSGKDQSNFTDPTGVHVYQEISKAGHNPAGGFVRYQFARAGEDGIFPKVSFVLPFKPWGWVITSGVYVDSIDTIFWNRALHSSGFSLLLMAVLIAVAVQITRTITRPLASAIALAKTVAAGDLSQRIEARERDEVGQLLSALSDMTQSLGVMVGNVRTSSGTIATSSDEIAQANIDLASRTSQQASALEQTSAAMEEMTATVKNNSSSANQANLMASSASEVAQKGGSVVAEVIEVMGSINDSSKKIADIIGVIDGIAFQTNILALNAAVEAARAGEQGRGFAVVATEVRNLAQRSASAAKEIKGLISTSVDRIDAGAKLVNQAGETMKEVVTSISRVAVIMNDIVHATTEQTTGIGQVNQAIAEIETTTQQNAALVEEVSAASTSMRDECHGLEEAVAIFKV